MFGIDIITSPYAPKDKILFVGGKLLAHAETIAKLEHRLELIEQVRTIFKKTIPDVYRYIGELP